MLISYERQRGRKLGIILIRSKAKDEFQKSIPPRLSSFNPRADFSCVVFLFYQIDICSVFYFFPLFSI